MISLVAAIKWARSRLRETTVTELAVIMLAFAMAVFQLWFTYMRMPFLPFRGAHLAFGLAIVFLSVPLLRSRSTWSLVIDWLLAAAALAGGIYLHLYHTDIVARLAMPTTSDFFFAGLVVLLILEACRRLTGWFLTTLVFIFLLYAFYGNLLPGMLWHRGHGLERVTTHLFMSGDGIYGMPIAVSATFIFLFILFGAVLRVTGGGQFFIDLSMALFARVRGGPAKISVLSSALMGTISGTASGNVAATGSITIPLMKGSGYRPHVAAGIECAASTGGPLLPPIMGAAAFLIPEFIGRPYQDVMLAALFPALVYFATVFFMVDLEALKTKASTAAATEPPDVRKVLREGWHFLGALAVLIYLLVGMRMTPTGAAVYSLAALIVIAFLRQPTFGTLTAILKGFVQAALDARIVIVASAAAGIVMGVITLTGTGVVLASRLVAFADGSMALLLLCAMAGAIILGMGIPPTAAYLVVAVLLAPALVQVGVEPIAAHLFVFYGAMAAMVSPPIALAVFAASALAQSSLWPTAWHAIRFSSMVFILPFIFAAQPILVTPGFGLEKLHVFIAVLLGGFMLAAALTGYLIGPFGLLSRTATLAAALLLFAPSVTTDVAGLAVGGAVVGAQFLARRSSSAPDGTDASVSTLEGGGQGSESLER